MTGVLSFLTSLPPIPLHQKSFCQHHIRRDKVRNSSPTLSLWLYSALLFPLVWKRKNPAIHFPRLSPYALLFLVPRIHLQSHLEPERSAITKKSSIALLVKHSGHLLGAFIFNGKALKCRTPPVPLKMYLLPCWMNYSTEEKNITSQCMNHSYLYSSPFLLFVFFTYILLNYVWPNTKWPSQNPKSLLSLWLFLWCHVHEMKSRVFRARCKLLSFLPIAALYSRIIQTLPLSCASGCHFSPIYYFLPFCLCDSVVNIFHDSKKPYCSPDPKKCPRMMRVLPHPLGEGEERIKHNTGVLQTSPPFLLCLTLAVQNHWLLFWKKNMGDLEENVA